MTRRIGALVLRVALLSGATFTASCKAKVGEPCNALDDRLRGSCKGQNAAIVCIGGEYTEVDCRGPGGCSNRGWLPWGGEVNCSVGGGEVGRGCMQNKTYGCSSDQKSMLVCKNHRWTAEMECSGPKGCQQTEHEANCDGAASKVGATCKQPGLFACSEDGGALLVCKESSMALASTCRGPNHCLSLGEKLKCDTSQAQLDDACVDEAKLSCDTDKRALLRCREGRFVKEKSCQKRCNNAFDKYECE
ncbi:MAG: hypothetical protein NVSMB1_02600 [Polyangiales bacterium]